MIVLRSFGKHLATNWRAWRSIGKLETTGELFGEQMVNLAITIVHEYATNIQRMFQIVNSTR